MQQFVALIAQIIRQINRYRVSQRSLEYWHRRDFDFNKLSLTILIEVSFREWQLKNKSSTQAD
ncbi:MAG: hypothetical protein RMX98_008270 [Nostoc sp. DedQUE02]|nr:hypothetical protein [Nostoc sp. DedQUE03]MDZ8048910.1 hypothetical protein [Nostoc sp. DedQUE02]